MPAATVTLPDLLADLAAETRVLDSLVGELATTQWDLATPAAGWAIRDQVSHLAFFDNAAVLAATDPDRFRAEAAGLQALGPDFPDRIAERYRTLPPARLTDWYTTARRELLAVFAGLGARTRIPWYGPDMSVASSATARLMETWAHGQDIADALGVRQEPTARLRHIAHIGVATFGFSYRLHGRPVPRCGVRVELTGPGGEPWTWGADARGGTITGPAQDFCLVVTQRRHVADTALRATGPVAAEWLSIAQAFAGAPGRGREPSGATIRRTT